MAGPSGAILRAAMWNPARTWFWTAALVAARAFDAVAAEPVPQVQIVWTDTPPQLDGRLDDPVWASAARVSDFTQVIPVPGAPPSQRTEVRILTDDKNLYFAIWCWDTDAKDIIAKRMVREGFLFFDDRFQIVIDTFHDRQNGYSFEINPVGGRRDVLLEGKAFAISWNTIWYGEASRDDKGWYAEIAIPYQSINYDPNKDVWGINFSRGIRRNNEEMRWADPVPQRFAADLGNAGEITGMVGKRSGVGLDIVPSLALSYQNGFAHDPDPATPPERIDSFKARPSGDIFYKVLPSLTATLTANTNFGETEADDRLVNFSRFAIALPEKRGFFLQDALIFEFSELTDDFSGSPSNAQPFYSRRIGIAQPDPNVLEFTSGEILFGGKIAGRIDDVKVGLLHTWVDELDEVGRQHLTVGRAAINVLEESTLGIIVTHGDPNGRIDNTLVGADFLYRNSAFRGDKSLYGTFWFQQSFSSDSDRNESAWSAGVSYPNDLVNWHLRYQEIGENYNPALGFVNRRGIRQYDGDYRYRFRQAGYLRTIDLQVLGSLTTDRNDRIESATARIVPVKIENEYAGRIELSFQHRFERPLGDFVLPGGLQIAAGAYHYNEGRLRLNASPNWAVTGGLTVGGGSYFGGTRLIAIPELEWRPNQYFLMKTQYELRNTWLPGQHGRVHVVRSLIAFYFTPNISWSTLVQYDNVSNSIGVNSRLRWIVSDGREIFVVLNQGANIIDDEIERGVTEPFAKIAWTFRF